MEDETKFSGFILHPSSFILQKVGRAKVNERVMHLTVVLAMLAAALTWGCARPPDVDRQVEEYAVYSALINSFPSEPGVDLLIANQTVPRVPLDREFDEEEFNKHNIPDATAKETINDYKLNDRQPLNIADRLSINRKYILINNQEGRGYFNNSNTRRQLREKYPTASDRIMMLSRVGFNRAMNEALVYTWAFCGGDCGGGGYYLLRKEDGVWTVKDKKLWIS